jgi:hypothetical protein
LGGANPPLPIGVGPYEDTLRRLDGGIDHKKYQKKNFQTFGSKSINFTP